MTCSPRSASRFRWLGRLGRQAICLLVLSVTVCCSAADAASPLPDAGSAQFTYVAAAGRTTLPQPAFLNAEHFTFSLLGVETGEDGKQVLAAIQPYTTASCAEKQAKVLNKMGPTIIGLSVVIDGASQSGPADIDVRFGGADQLTQFAIYGLVKSYQATMRIGLLDTTTGWRVATARILNAKNSNPACN